MVELWLSGHRSATVPLAERPFCLIQKITENNDYTDWEADLIFIGLEQNLWIQLLAKSHEMTSNQIHFTSKLHHITKTFADPSGYLFLEPNKKLVR